MALSENHGTVPKPLRKATIFECLSHNLLMRCEKHIETTEGIRDEVEEKSKLVESRPLQE